ncbi:MAG: VWA domain-containing protein [Dehalococcoidia bacterium]
MSFQWPWMLVLLLVVPLLAGLYVWSQKRRRKYVLRYSSVSLVQQAVGKGPGMKRHVPAVLYLLALTAMIFAIARPSREIPVLQNTGTIILTIDVSGSMQAEDVEPNRLEATKDAIHDFVQRQPDGVKIGVVSFSNAGSLVAPPTTDKKQILDAVDRLRPQEGTNMGSGLQVALDAIYALRDTEVTSPTPGTSRVPTPTPTPVTPGSVEPINASIVLISDGQSTVGPDPLEFAEEAAAQGIKVYTIGIGTPEGTVLMIRGRNVFTRLDETVLRSISEQTQGTYFNAQDRDDLKQVYDELDRERSVENEETEITFAFAGIAMLITMAAGGLGLLWFNRLP